MRTWFCMQKVFYNIAAYSQLMEVFGLWYFLKYSFVAFMCLMSSLSVKSHLAAECSYAHINFLMMSAFCQADMENV